MNDKKKIYSEQFFHLAPGLYKYEIFMLKQIYFHITQLFHSIFPILKLELYQIKVRHFLNICAMLLTIVFLCVILGLLLWSFLKSKFASLLLESAYHINSYKENPQTLSIPGPRKIPFFGSKWIYFWRYNLSKVHEAYAG